jgi:DNA repair protein RecO (recombination protein O)
MLAVVLARRDFRENDQIITLYTAEKGKMEALARGVKKIISKNASSLEPFGVIDVEIVPGKEVNHIIKTHTIQLFVAIKSDLQKMLTARYCLGLVDELAKVGTRNAGIFYLLVDWLSYVDSAETPGHALTMAFVLRLLGYLGFEPELKRCTKNGEEVLAKDTVNYFNIVGGGVVCSICRLKFLNKREPLIAVNFKIICNLRHLLKSPFQVVNELKFLQTEERVIGVILYNFATYHCGQKINDWRDLCKMVDEI